MALNKESVRRYYWVLYLFGGVLLAIMAYVYYTYDPADHLLFPKCPFKSVTGLDCPGCGSQRAIHALLHGHFGEAFHHNALVLPFIPYIAVGLYFRTHKELTPKQLYWRKFLFGEYAIKITGGLILLYFVIRNVY